MRTLLAASAGAVLLTLTIASLSAQAALICKDGYLHYGGSGLYANRLEAEASAIEAWRRVRAGNDSDALRYACRGRPNPRHSQQSQPVPMSLPFLDESEPAGLTR
jgi:hypothetical protein